jgi:nucleoid-associated protein YgaU
MGLLSFVKSAGAKLLGMEDEEAIKKEAAAKAQAEEAVEKLRRARFAARLKQQLATHGLELDDAEISYDGETVTVAGKVADQATREKVVLALGNNEGVAAVDDRIEVVNKEPEATFYTVQKGDTLWAISKEHYGDGNKYHAIFEANKPMLEHPDRIYPGQVLRIPPQG